MQIKNFLLSKFILFTSFAVFSCQIPDSDPENYTIELQSLSSEKRSIESVKFPLNDFVPSELPKSLSQYLGISISDQFPDRPSVGLLSSTPKISPKTLEGENATPQGGNANEETKKDPEMPTVLIMWGWPGSGIFPNDFDLGPYRGDDLNPNSLPYRLIQAQWPGSSFVLDNQIIESDPIPFKYYLPNWKEGYSIGTYYAALFKELKKKYGKIHVIGQSNGGLTSMLGLCSLTEEEREGISLTLVDAGFRDSVIIDRPIGYIIDYILSQIEYYWLTPTYRGDLYDILTFPITLYGTYLYSSMTKLFEEGLGGSVFPAHSFKTSQFSHMGMRWFQNQEYLFKLLENVKDESLDIRQVIALTGNIDSAMQGNGTRKGYLNFLEEKILPKCKPNADGTKRKLILREFGHTNFLRTKEFPQLIYDGLEVKQST